MKYKSATEALEVVKSGQRVFVHGGTATPHELLQGLVDSAPRLESVELIHLHLEGGEAYARSELARSFRSTSLFVGAAMRRALDYDRVDYLPCFLSEMPQLFRSGRR